MADAREPLYCSFCRRDDATVPSLVAGPGVFICGDCVKLASKAIKGERIPDFPGWATMDDDALLGSLGPAVAVVRRVDVAVDELIALLRRRGVSWARIGEALGVSRQAAWERYASG